MKFSLKYNQGIIEVKTFGDAELQVFIEFINSILNDKNWEPGGKILVDYTELNFTPLAIGDVEDIAQFCTQNREKFGRAKIASILTQDLEYGFGRVWQAYSDNYWDATGELFRYKDEAVRWLSA